MCVFESFSGFRGSAQGVVKHLLQVLATAQQREKGRKEEDGEKEREGEIGGQRKGGREGGIEEGNGETGKEEGREAIKSIDFRHSLWLAAIVFHLAQKESPMNFCKASINKNYLKHHNIDFCV